MKKTPNLELPVYDTPSVDTFRVDDWNKANENIDYVFGELKNNPNVNAIDIKAREDIINNHRSITEQMESNTRELNSLECANADEVLALQNYLNNYQNIHPKVLSFDTAWNGFKYWMAYTPYPKGVTTAENPCISASNDLINWVTPDKLVNPIEPAPSDGYNSDTHLVYRADLNRIECWWRYYRTSTYQMVIYRRCSNDGFTWSDKEVIFDESTSAGERYSPAIIFEDGKYKMWFCRSQYVYYQESVGTDITRWTNASVINIDWASQNLRPWHLDVIHTDLGYEMVIQAFDKTTGNNNKSDLYYVLQKNNGEFTQPKLILSRGTNPRAIDFTTIYRSSIIKENGIYYLFYSCIDANSNRWMSLSTGNNILKLNGMKRKSVNKIYINSESTLRDFDVTHIDEIYITKNSTIESFVGGYAGKSIKIFVVGTSTQCTIKHTLDRMLIPTTKDYILTYKNEGFMQLVCSNFTKNEWKALVKVDEGLISFTQGDILNDIATNGVNTIVCSGTGEVVINSLTSDRLGKTINVIIGGSSTTVKLVYSSRLITPGLVDFTFNKDKMGITLVCTSLSNGGVFRAF